MSEQRPVLWIDFETYSECNIKLRGGMNYTTHPSTQVVCLGWALGDEQANLWTPAEPELPATIIQHVEAHGIVVAHNLTFDYRIWNFIGHEQLGWPKLSLDQCLDSMALCQTYQVPASLENAGNALGIAMRKDTDGKRLIKICCTPQKNGLQPTPWGPHSESFKALFRYCRQDVRAMREIVHKLPRQHLIPIEHEIWKMTYEMNTLGLPVDTKVAKKIMQYVATYTEKELRALPMLCGGAFLTIGQIAKIRAWCGTQGYEMESLDAEHVQTALDDPSCPPKVYKVLEMRQELGRSSTAKYKKLLELACEETLHDNLVYHGAGPGRWSGKGFQMHNLPRASLRNEDHADEVNDAVVEEAIQKFLTGQEVENPVFCAKALIRAMIRAKDDEVVICSDYSGIENRVLHWLALDEPTLQDFRDGVDQYKVMASARYNVPYAEVTKPQRQMGKVIILGCGYGMGKDTFVTTAKDQFRMIVTIEEATEAVKAYREKYHLVKKLWNEIKLAATRTVITGQKQTYGFITFGLARVNGITWLAMKLPSGKCVYYMDPRVSQEFIPDYEHMGRVPTITHMGTNPYSKKWCRLKLIPGRITENAVQGTAREVMALGMLNVKAKMPQVKLIGTVHDEAIGLIKKVDLTENTLAEFNHHLCDISWAKDCPIKAEGWVGPRYRK